MTNIKNDNYSYRYKLRSSSAQVEVLSLVFTTVYSKLYAI
jgi:hypothetical protein